MSGQPATGSAEAVAEGVTPADPSYGWVVVSVLATTETVSFSVLYYAFGVFLVPMRIELGISTLEAAGAFSLALAVAGLCGLIVGRWLDSRSPRPLMAAGSVLGALLVLAWSQIGSVAQLYAVFAGIGVAMAMVLYEPAFIVVTKWFSVRRHQALTAVTLVAALASFIFSPLSQYLISNLGWRHTLFVLALVLAVVTVPLHALGLRAPTQTRTQVAEVDTGEITAKEPAGLPLICLLTACFVLLSLVSSALGVLLVSLLVSSGQTSAFAAGVAGLMGVSQIPGRILFAIVGHRIDGWPLPAIDWGGRTGGGTARIRPLRSRRCLLRRHLWDEQRHGHPDAGWAGGRSLWRGSVRQDPGVAAAFVSAARAMAPFAAAGAALLRGGYLTLLWLMAGASALAAAIGARAVARATRARSNEPALTP